MRKGSLVVPVSLLAALTACGASTVGPTVATGQHHTTDQVSPQQVSPATAPAAATTTTTPACRTGKLSVRLGASEGAAGSVYTPLVFTNTGRHACTLAGYPGVSYVAPDTGRQVGAAATRNPQHPARTVTLRPGGHAAAVVQMVDYRNYPAAQCYATAVSGLRVYPPNSTTAAYVTFRYPTRACSTAVEQLSVEAVVHGTTGQ